MLKDREEYSFLPQILHTIINRIDWQKETKINMWSLIIQLIQSYMKIDIIMKWMNDFLSHQAQKH